MKKSISLCLCILYTGFTSLPAAAHFQMIYTPKTALNEGQATDLALIFTHPFKAYPNMDMGKPQAFYVVSQRGENAPEKSDLTPYLEAVDWRGTGNSAKAYLAKLPKKVTRSLGDYIFVLEPEPYLEPEEDGYIQQYTKMMLNVGGIPGNWAEPLGLPAEILPLNQPYANWTGGIFRGLVLSHGEPVANAEIEIEYLNHEPDMDAKAFNSSAAVQAPHESFVNMAIRTNDRGEFAISLPKAGWWGICALGVGPQTQYKGKGLSQDAVLWVQATDMH